MPTWRRAMLLIAFLTIFALRLDRQLMRLPFMNREPIGMALTMKPDRLWPPFPRFIQGVREHTQPGDSIAIVTPTLAWDEGYSYAYYRASYILSGREVLPVSLDDNRPRPENLKRAKYLAVWGRGVPPDRSAVIWQGEGGVLLRQ